MVTERLPDGLAAGWSARLELGYARRAGVTVPTLRRHAGPLRVLRHATSAGGALEHVLVHPPGGIAGGDRLDYDIELAAGADVLLTSVGAAKWYDGFGRASAQRVAARLGPGARLSWLPLENILYRGADVELVARFDLAPAAALFYADVVCLGRPASGERYTRGRWRSRTEIAREGALVWSERTVLDAASPLLSSPAGLAGHPVVGTIAYAGPGLPEALHATVLALTVDGEAAAAQLPGLWLARFVGDSTEGAQRWLRAIRRLLHAHTHGCRAYEPRIWTT